MGYKEHKHIHRDDKIKNCLLNRLKRIEGQVRGVIRMVEDDQYCPDILIQTAAINSAINSFNKELISQHIRNCVLNDVKNGDEEVLEELINTLKKVMK